MLCKLYVRKGSLKVAIRDGDKGSHALLLPEVDRGSAEIHATLDELANL